MNDPLQRASMSPSSGDTVLRFHGADIGYSGPVISAAELSVSAGEVVGLVGPNGAGKSTLLKAVTGEAVVLGGQVLLEGNPLPDLDPRQRACLVGVVPQQTLAAYAFSAEEFVAMGRHPHVARFAPLGDQDRAIVDRVLRMTDTERLREQPIDTLSGGDLQRLALAQALAQEPRLLLLDEPTSHLDLNHQLQVLDLVRDLASDGLAVLAVFHDLDLAARYSDRVAVVANGALSAAETPECVIDAQMLRSVFGVRAVVGIDPVTGAVAVTPVLRDGAVARERRGRALVVGGSGVAAPLLRRLVLDGWEVSAAALNLGDADATLAKALGLSFVAIPPFAPMDEEARSAVGTLAEEADVVVVCDVPFGHGNIGNLEAAVQGGRELVLVGSIAGRDYTGGRAEALWTEAIERGALQVAGVDQLLTELAARHPCSESVP